MTLVILDQHCLFFCQMGGVGFFLDFYVAEFAIKFSFRRGITLCNEKTYKKFQKGFLKLMLISLVFILSCGKSGTEEGATKKGEPEKWYVKLGFSEVCKQMKDDTQLLTKRLNFSEFEEAEALCNKISSTFAKLDANDPDVPKDFLEFKERFENSLAKVMVVSKEKKSEDVAVKVKALKHSCKYCHKIFRKDMSAAGYEKDFGVAVDKLYKDGYTDK